MSKKLNLINTFAGEVLLAIYAYGKPISLDTLMKRVNKTRQNGYHTGAVAFYNVLNELVDAKLISRGVSKGETLAKFMNQLEKGVKVSKLSCSGAPYVTTFVGAAVALAISSRVSDKSANKAITKLIELLEYRA